MAPSNSERTPLISSSSVTKRLNKAKDGLALSSDEDPTFIASFKHLLLGSWLNVLLIAVPLSFASYHAHWGSTPTFVISFLAIVPLASLLGEATEQVSMKLGQALGALLNATFGNAVEAIVGIIALQQNQLRIVQTSLLGSILSNILLVLGCSFFAAGFKRPESKFSETAAQNSASALLLATATLIIPAAYHASVASGDAQEDLDGLLFLSRSTSILLLVIYACYLFFQLKTHAFLFAAEEEAQEEEESPKMSFWPAIISLIAVTLLTAFVADYLVDSIDDFAERFNLPKAFIGLILIPIVGNAAEHVTSVWMAVKDKMEITIGVSVGSSIQIAIGVIPLLVVIAWPMGRDLTLYFGVFETICLFIGCLIAQMVLIDGKSNWFEGLLLMSTYIVIGLSFWAQ